MQALEKALGDAFKKAPQMPENARKALANALPWIALVVGVLSLWGAWLAYGAATVVTDLSGLVGYSYGLYAPSVAGNLMFVWVGAALLLLQAIILLVAFPALKAHKKSGWNMLFWAELIYVVYDLVYYLFAYVNPGQLVFSLVGAAVSLYLLFQVRGHFGGTPAPAAPKATSATDKKE